ncbi:hypothetical protein [Stenotrophomonas sp. LMG 10879]|uniref:hypothetical protein n=1 Tax=Stenotrophomonas sp. LMG 10879 TaxID=487706 RepID=UPI0010547C96|nr:hypothetical protein [Stenotrophomonas sp. LMG 10879]
MKSPPVPAAESDRAMEGPSPNLFLALRDLLLPYKADLLVVHDEGDHFYANCRNVDAKGKAQFFSAVKVSGRRHSFHFMPIYTFPELLAGISPALKKHMQGKSCFNFDAWDPSLLHELQMLIEQGVSRYRSAAKL